MPYMTLSLGEVYEREQKGTIHDSFVGWGVSEGTEGCRTRLFRWIGGVY